MSEKHGIQVGPVMLFSAKRPDVERFYREIVGLDGAPGGDATWLDAQNAKVVVHEPGDRQTPPEVQKQSGFVVWFGVADVRAAYDRARRAGAAIGDFHGDFFFASDPEGRYVGIYALEGGHGHDHEH
ncbi:MAG TPA: hypothetical protein VJQ09_02600 [Candidatus Limnocylindria bacterium]|nr:hypothetical protein [Candidatus Limnocylindria bacterium]